MSVSEAFRAIFNDRQWGKKLGLAALVSLIPYVGAVAFSGYALRHLRNTSWDRAQELPEWKGFAEFLKTGFFALLAGVVYTIPISLLISFVAVIAIIVGVAIGQSGVIPALILMMLVIFFLIGVISLLGQLIVWPVYTQVALYETLQSGFDFKGIYARAKSNSPAYWQAARSTLLLSGASFLVSGVLWGVWLAFFGVVMFATSSDAGPLGTLLVFPTEMVMIALTMLISVPIQIAISHLWGEYGRSAYDLGNPTITEASMQAEYAPEPTVEYLPQAPLQ